MSKKHDGYILKDPKGKLIPSTFAGNKMCCWQYTNHGYDYVSKILPDLGEYFRCDERRSIRYAEDHGYKIVKCKFVEVEDNHL